MVLFAVWVMLAQVAPPVRIVVAQGTGAGFVPAPEGARAPVERNEAAAVELCLHYVDAQAAYLRMVGMTADRIRSTAGAHDGLYWPAGRPGDESPAGPKFADAAFTEHPWGHATPRFGYYVRILPAPGRLLVVWPSAYRVTGIRTFVVDVSGNVYAKDLGPGTQRAVLRMDAFVPEGGWTLIASGDESRELR